MTEGSMVKQLTIERRKRVIATILGHVEREWLYKGLISKSQYETFRSVTLGSIGDWHDLMLDILKISDQDMMRNERAVELLERVHANQTALSDQVAALADGP